jgi:hypothetical protein
MHRPNTRSIGRAQTGIPEEQRSASEGGTVTRPTIDLDGAWRFVPDPERLFSVETLPAVGDPIQVPGVWEAQVDRPARIITAWYRREVEIPADWAGFCALFRFGAVMYACSVWLNGQHLGDHEGGYTPFVLDGGHAMRPGASNELLVRVVNPLNAIAEFPAFAVERIQVAEELEPDLPLSEAPHGKQTWYMSMSGLWQSVCVERAARTWLANVLALPDVPDERVTIRWSIEGESPPPSFQLELRVLAPDGSEVGHERIELVDGVRRGQTTITVPQPVLWDIGRPNLYRLEGRLLDEGKQVDLLARRFGMRQIEVSQGRVLLNGRSVYLLAALDQDLYPDTIWTPPSREMLDRQLVLAKEMGLNLLRCHIKTPDPMYLDAADEAGMLLWCELPNWSKLTGTSMRRGRETLEAMVDCMGNHPSIVIWTIINEDWGTQLRYEARDRLWLREMYDWLKELDPTRLAVDNSACETDETPNFHVRTDLADFHLYFGMPDNAVRWRNRIAEYAGRPAWLWSPHGDARPSGDEPLILSEFGNWGLPRLDTLLEHYGRDPWWFGTGQIYYRPAGLTRRFRQLGLDRIWPDVSALAEGTQWHQFEALQYEIGEMRRHPSIAGYVITEFADAYWEANGLLDIARNPKAFHSRLREINAPEVVIADLARRDLWGGDVLNGELSLSSYDDAAPRRGRITWSLQLGDGQQRHGELPVDDWPHRTWLAVGDLAVAIPTVHSTTDARLVVTAYDDDGERRAMTDLRLAIMPRRAGRAARRLRVAVNDVHAIWGLDERVRELGHEVASVAGSDVLLTSEIDERVLRYADDGGRVLVNVRTRGAVPEHLDLNRRVEVHLRRGPYAGYPGQRSPWEGDWVNSFSWILPGLVPDLPQRAPLDFAFEEVLPDHVMLGYDPVRHRDEVPAGMFVGWVHSPAALIWSFPHGHGWLTLTTLRLAPECGPIATALLEGLLQRSATTADRDGHEPSGLLASPLAAAR